MDKIKILWADDEIDLLKAELHQAMAHVGAPTLGDLAAGLHRDGD